MQDFTVSTETIVAMWIGRSCVPSEHSVNGTAQRGLMTMKRAVGTPLTHQRLMSLKMGAVYTL